MNRRKTGAGHTLNPDSYGIYIAVIVMLCGAVIAAGVASVDGLIHAAAWMVPPPLQWTLPVAVDVFLVGTALATLALRKRGAYWEAGGVAFITAVLVAFSAVTNWLYVTTSTEPGTEAHAYGPFIKASMPILLLAATEIVAAMTSTRNNRENSPLNKAKRDLAKAKADLRSERKRKAVLAVAEQTVWAEGKGQ